MNGSRKLHTGMRELDRALGGGLPTGSITVLEAPPGSQGYLFLQELTASRGTIWMSFARTEDAIEYALAESPATSGEPTIKFIENNRADSVRKLLTAVPDQSNIILEPVDILEESMGTGEFRGFLNDLQRHLVERGSLAMLYCNSEKTRPGLRETTKYYADVVLEVTNRPKRGDIEYFLRVPKYRRGDCPSSIIKLDLRRGVDVDTSRDIG